MSDGAWDITKGKWWRDLASMGRSGSPPSSHAEILSDGEGTAHASASDPSASLRLSETTQLTKDEDLTRSAELAEGPAPQHAPTNEKD